MTPFWEGFTDGLLLCGAALGSLLAGALLWAVLATLIGSGWALGVVILALVFSTVMGILYSGTSFDPLDDESDTW